MITSQEYAEAIKADAIKKISKLPGLIAAELQAVVAALDPVVAIDANRHIRNWGNPKEIKTAIWAATTGEFTRLFNSDFEWNEIEEFWRSILDKIDAKYQQ